MYAKGYDPISLVPKEGSDLWRMVALPKEAMARHPLDTEISKEIDQSVYPYKERISLLGSAKVAKGTVQQVCLCSGVDLRRMWADL